MSHYQLYSKPIVQMGTTWAIATLSAWYTQHTRLRPYTYNFPAIFSATHAHHADKKGCRCSLFHFHISLFPLQITLRLQAFQRASGCKYYHGGYNDTYTHIGYDH